MTVNVTPTIGIRVLCFAQLRDHMGTDQIVIHLPAGAAGHELLRVLGERHPKIRPLLGVSRLAVNCEYVSADHPLNDGDEVVVIPPVSGG